MPLTKSAALHSSELQKQSFLRDYHIRRKASSSLSPLLLMLNSAALSAQ
jgi:hypothetical protein